MKKLIAVSTLFAVSSLAVAQVGFSDPNDSRTQQPAEQNVVSEMKTAAPEQGMKAEGKRKFDGKQAKHNGKPLKEGKNKEFKPPFFDESKAVKSVKALQDAKDKTFVMIEGKIIKQVGKKDFIFQDSTGEVEIEVSYHAWRGQTITPNDTVEIRGIVDKEWDKTEVEVKQIIKK